MHVHSDLSPCSGQSLAQIAARSDLLPIDGVCLTDHQVMAHPSRVVKAGGQGLMLVGLEYATPAGDFLLLGLELAPPEGLPAADVLGLANALGAAVIAAHPCRQGRSVDPAVLELGLVHAVEAFNGRCTDAENALAISLARRFGLPATGGSDAHTPGEVGRFATSLERPVSNVAQLAREVIKGRVRAVAPAASNGPRPWWPWPDPVTMPQGPRAPRIPTPTGDQAMHTIMTPGRLYMGKLAHGRDLLDELTAFCERTNIFHGSVQAIGAVSRARYGYYDQSTRVYEYLELNEPAEILSLIGNISIKDGRPMVHGHITLADEKGRAMGGHLAQGCVIFACEFIIQEHLSQWPLERKPDEETGLMLWAQP